MRLSRSATGIATSNVVPHLVHLNSYVGIRTSPARTAGQWGGAAARYCPPAPCERSAQGRQTGHKNKITKGVSNGKPCQRAMMLPMPGGRP